MDAAQTLKKPADLLLCKTCLRSCQTVKEFLYHKCTCARYPQNCDLCDKSINSKIELEVHFQCWHNIPSASKKGGLHRFSTSCSIPKAQSLHVPAAKVSKPVVSARKDSPSTVQATTKSPVNSAGRNVNVPPELSPEPPTNSSKNGKTVENKPQADASLDIVGALHGVAAALQPITDATYKNTETNPETTRIIGVLKNVASALNPLLKDNPTVKTKNTGEDKTIKEAVEQLCHLYKILENSLKELIENRRKANKEEPSYVCTLMTVVVNGTIEITVKPKPTDVINKIALPAQQKTQSQRCIEPSQPNAAQPRQVSAHGEKVNVPIESKAAKPAVARQMVAAGGPFQLPPGMMMVKCKDPAALQQGIPLVRLPGFAHHLPRVLASVPAKSNSGVAVATGQLSGGGAKPVILATSSLPSQVSTPRLLFVPSTVSSSQTVFTAVSCKPASRATGQTNIQQPSIQAPAPQKTCMNSSAADGGGQPVKVDNPVNGSNSGRVSAQQPKVNSETCNSDSGKEAKEKLPPKLDTTAGSTQLDDKNIKLEAQSAVADLSTKKRKSDDEASGTSPTKQLKSDTQCKEKLLSGAQQSVVAKSTELEVREELVLTSTQQISSSLQENFLSSSDEKTTTKSVIVGQNLSVSVDEVTNGKTSCQGHHPSLPSKLKVESVCEETLVDGPVIVISEAQARCKGCETSFPGLYQQYPNTKNAHRTSLTDMTAPYKCPDCEYESGDEMAMVHHHAEDHSGFQCPQCQTVCEDTSSLQHHVSFSHPTRVIEV